MKLVFAPSGKRMVPYPPVGPALLAGALRDAGAAQPAVVDLELRVWRLHRIGVKTPLAAGALSPNSALQPSLAPDVEAYGALLANECGLQPGEDIGISVMGFEQLASALVLARHARRQGSRVIFGGQFWSEISANEVLGALQDSAITVTVGDGFKSIVDWLKEPDRVPPGSFRWLTGEILKCAPTVGKVLPPTPSFTGVDWALYEEFGKFAYGDASPVRRAHLYVWDKLCPFRCTFCRVSSGSNVRLGDPSALLPSLRALLDEGVVQMNFMTNELNPSLSYLKRVCTAFRPVLGGRSDVGWFTYLRPDAIDDSDFEALRQLGCRLVRWGVETGSQSLSDKMQKDYHLPTVSRVLRAAAKAGLTNHVNLLIGYPGETERDIEQTLEFVCGLADVIHSVRINPFYLPPGTKLASEPQRFGLRLLQYRSGYWSFEMADGTVLESSVVQSRIERVSARLVEVGIGFAGVLPFELLNALCQHTSRDKALLALRVNCPHFWSESSPDALKARFGNYNASTSWSQNIFQRGRNYQTVVCTD